MMLFRSSMMSATLHVFCILLVYIANDTLDICIRSFSEGHVCMVGRSD
jgi:hypothetical protein